MSVADCVNENDWTPQKKMEIGLWTFATEKFGAVIDKTGGGKVGSNSEKLEEGKSNSDVSAAHLAEGFGDGGEEETVGKGVERPECREHWVGAKAWRGDNHEGVGIDVIARLLPAAVDVAIEVGGIEGRNAKGNEGENNAGADDDSSIEGARLQEDAVRFEISPEDCGKTGQEDDVTEIAGGVTVAAIGEGEIGSEERVNGHAHIETDCIFLVFEVFQGACGKGA